MGQGGYLLLKNKTPYRWKKTLKSDYQMKSWKNSFPETIEPNSSARVYIEWTEGTKNEKDDAGEVDYTMEGINAVFQLQARAKNNFEIKVFCKNFQTNQINNGDTVSLGWAHNNTLVFMVAGSQGKFTSLGSRQNANKWMMNIGDHKKISELTIPGTHDTVTYMVNKGLIEGLPNKVLTYIPGVFGAGSVIVKIYTDFTKCQNMKLDQQLNQGIRFLDVRLKKDGAKLEAYHSSVRLHTNFSEIMSTCYAFLRNNNSETIIISIKNEGKGEEPIDTLVKAEIDAHPEMWYTGTSIPVLGKGDQSTHCRGRLVLIRRYACASEVNKIGINVSGVWPDNTQKDDISNSDMQKFAIQDEYENYILPELDHKFKNHVRPYLDKAKQAASDTLFINFSSGVGTTGGLVYPKTLANGSESWSTFKGTNQLIFSYLLDKMEGRYGIIPMDFPEYPNDSLIPLLISTNSF